MGTILIYIIAILAMIITTITIGGFIPVKGSTKWNSTNLTLKVFTAIEDILRRRMWSNIEALNEDFDAAIARQIRFDKRMKPAIKIISILAA